MWKCFGSSTSGPHRRWGGGVYAVNLTPLEGLGARVTVRTVPDGGGLCLCIKPDCLEILYLYIFRKAVRFMLIQELMNPSVVTIEPTSSAALAARLLSRHNVGALPVCGDDRRLRGIITDRDIVLRCVAAEDDPAQTPVRDIMTRGCATVAPGDDCREATRLMSAQQVRRLPVVENGRVVGMVSLGDLARTQRYDMEAAKALSEISENVTLR